VSVDQAAYDFDKSISETVGRYEQQVRIWDVVNEPIEPSHGRADGMRSKTWTSVNADLPYPGRGVRVHRSELLPLASTSTKAILLRAGRAEAMTVKWFLIIAGGSSSAP
jgi:hypothetical protein